MSLADFPKEGMSLSRDIPLEASLFPEDLVSAVEGISLDMQIQKMEKNFRLCGNLRWRLDLICSRCLDPFPQSGVSEIRNSLQPPSLDPDPDAFTYEGEEFDLYDMARELVELHLPMKPLCAEGCKGLCPVCGKNLNRKSCDCVPQGTDPRWNALEKLKKGV